MGFGYPKPARLDYLEAFIFPSVTKMPVTNPPLSEYYIRKGRYDRLEGVVEWDNGAVKQNLKSSGLPCTTYYPQLAMVHGPVRLQTGLAVLIHEEENLLHLVAVSGGGSGLDRNYQTQISKYS